MRHQRTLTALALSVVFGYTISRCLETPTLDTIYRQGHNIPTGFAGTRFAATKDQFYLNKISQKSNYDIVIAGDSRVTCGVAPGYLKNELHGLRIFNFGFNGQCYTPEYLQAVAALLDPKSSERIIILGISPQSLTLSNSSSNGFHKYNHMDRWEQKRLMTMSKIFKPFQPFLSEERDRVLRVYHSDGWSAEKRAISKKGLREIQRQYKNAVLSETLIKNLFSSVNDWTYQGIRVYGYFIPISVEIRQFEKETIHLDENNFIASFLSDGGIWIDIDPSQYSWNDGHHMEEEVAIRFTKDLGQAIRKHDKPSSRRTP